MSQASPAKTLTSFRRNVKNVRIGVKSQATFHVDSILNATPYLAWDILHDAHRCQAPIDSLWDRIGASHDKLFKSMKKDQAGSVQSLAQFALTNMAEFQGRKFEDYLQVDGKFSSSSLNGLFSHFYTFFVNLTIPDAASAIKDGGVYPLWDISHYPDINGMVFTNNPEGKAFMDEFARLRLDGNELRSHIAKNRAQNMITLNKIINKGVAPPGDQECYILLGTFGTRYRGIHTVNIKQPDGTIFTGQVMLLEPDIRHPFVGWIQHMFLVTGPNTVSSVALGGGEGKVPLLDCFSSWLAPWLWSLVKIISAQSYRINHKLTPVGKELDEANFEQTVAKATDHLSLQFWIAKLLLAGGPMGAWCQEAFGRAGVATMTDEEYTNRRKRDKQIKGWNDDEGRSSERTQISHTPHGELDKTTILDKKTTHNNGSNTNNKMPPNTGNMNTQKDSKSKTPTGPTSVKSPKDKSPGARPKPAPSFDTTNKTTTSLKNGVKEGNVQPKRSASITSPSPSTQDPVNKQSPSGRVNKPAQSPTNKQQPSTQSDKPSQTLTGKQASTTLVARPAQTQTGKQQVSPQGALMPKSQVVGSTSKQLKSDPMSKDKGRPSATPSKTTQPQLSNREPSNQTVVKAQPQKVDSPIPKHRSDSGIKATTIPALKVMPGDGFSLTTKEMRTATMGNWRTLEAYFNLSGERATGKSLEKGPLATTIREKCNSQLNKQKLDVATRLHSFTAPESLPANEFFLRQQIFDRAKMFEVVEAGVEATEALVPVLAKDRMAKIAEMAKTKKVQVPKELGQESVTKMIREACMKILVYPFADLHQSGFTANAMDEVVARLAIKQLMFEYQKTDEGLKKIAWKAREIYGKGDHEAEANLQAQGEAEQRKMAEISDMIRELKQRQDQAIKAMKADFPKQTKL